MMRCSHGIDIDRPCQDCTDEAMKRIQTDGMEVKPGIVLIGSPTLIVGTDKAHCLANVGGALCLVELRILKTEPSARAPDQGADITPPATEPAGGDLSGSGDEPR